LRILLAVGAVALLRDPHVDLGALGRVRLFDFGGVIAAVGMGMALLVSILRNGLALARQEPPRQGRRVGRVPPGENACPAPAEAAM
jgi:hypothetical protein